MKLFATFTFLLPLFLLGQQQYDFVPAKDSFDSKALKESINLSYETSLKKIPSEFSLSQKLYLTKEYRDKRSYFLEMVESGELIGEGSLYNYVDSLCKVIISENVDIPDHLQVMLVKDLSCNAFNAGDDIVFIHLGLLFRVESEEQLAFVLCHEIAHNMLEHNRLRMEKYTDEVKNDSITREIIKRYRKVYGNVTALNELMVPWLISNKEASRKNEFEADSLGMVYFSNIDMNIQDAVSVFQILEDSENERYHEDWKNSPIARKLLECDFDVENSYSTYKGSSISRVGLEKDETMDELLRSHPHEEDRKTKLIEDFNLNPDLPKPESRFRKWKFDAENEYINCAFNKGMLTRVLFDAIQSDSLHTDNNFSLNLTALSFAILGYEKSVRRESDWVGWLNHEANPIYKDFYSFLRKQTPDNCMKIAECLSNQMKEGIYKEYCKALFYCYTEQYSKFKVTYEELKTNEKKLVCYPILREFYERNESKIK